MFKSKKPSKNVASKMNAKKFSIVREELTESTIKINLFKKL